MHVDLGEADAAVAVGIFVIDDYLHELVRIGRLPTEYTFTRSVDPDEALADLLESLGISPPPLLHFTVKLDPPPVFLLAKPPGAPPYTRLELKGTIEVRPATAPDPSSPPLTTYALNAPVRLALVLTNDPVPAVKLEYQGTDGPPDPPVTPEDVDRVFESEEVQAILTSTTIDIAAPLIAGLNQSRFPDPDAKPPDADWDVALTLMPGGGGNDDCFTVSAAAPGASAAPAGTDSFLRSQTGMGFAYARAFLDLMLERGAQEKRGKKIEKAVVRTLRIWMGDTAIEVEGHVVRPVKILPDVDIRFDGPLVPSLVRGTITMAFDPTGIRVKLDEDDEIVYWVLRWFVTVGSAALLFTGMWWATAIGIASWLTLVQEVWKAEAEIANAPNLLRESLAAALGASMSALADALDDDSEVEPLKVDATPDSLEVHDGNLLLFAQILIVPIEAMMKKAEHSRRLDRFVIFELTDGRRFRAQELARLMKIGKVTVPGFHQVDGNYVRADPDNVEANNLLKMFDGNETREVIFR
ncbi:MAG: hypothetical protein M3217_03670 [Actinomycetota bacterium]|nr:hypothetical protein [Actinomycetota bacterium]